MVTASSRSRCCIHQAEAHLELSAKVTEYGVAFLQTTMLGCPHPGQYMTMGLSRMTSEGGFGQSTLIVFLQSVQIVKVCTGKPLSAQKTCDFIN